MRPLSVAAPTLAIITTFASSVGALQSLGNSPCATQCGNILSSTSGFDIECQDARYYVTPGSIFQACVSCQLASKYVDPQTKQTDLQWGLYNLRYAVSWCLFGYPNNNHTDSTPCTTSFSCGLVQSGFEFDSLNPASSQYGYCTQYHPNDVLSCNNCLKLQQGKFYLNNFATALDAACQQQPAPGQTISVEGNVFSDIKLNISTPKPDDGGTYSPMGGLSVGAKAGIAVAALIVLLAITGFCIIWKGRRRRRRILQQRQRESGYADWRTHHNFEQAEVHGGSGPGDAQMQDGSSSAGGFFDSPASTRPLVNSRPWAPANREEESPLSAVGEKAYFSPYSSHYSSPVSPEQQMAMGTWSPDRKGSVGFGRSQTRNVDNIERVEREPDGDRIEMQNVAPVLLHPGNGRGKPAGPHPEEPRNF
ncbi:hypothetical protein HYALB_00010978 [Hymenoscyphus albidus]|uniref:LPXTG-domain-containing protein n=1 Tax=Hymenoscyphus albidus TaxID=595503 RepID=A0A9N9LQY9_9HELO|nr:hypothetical protein HYALB_00010978 [Hymenoscyphus albidus]